MKKIYLLLTFIISFATNAQVVISQFYGGGGNSSATYTNDFIEIFNKGTIAQNLSGWSIQYNSATGTTWTAGNKADLPNITLQPGQYFLLQGASGGAVGAALPTPDQTSTINLSASNGKLVLCNTTTLVTGANPTDAQIVDKVGYGSTANGFETAAAGSGSNTTAGFRLNGGCTDNNNNSTDFTIQTPSPRNTSSTLAPCSTDPDISIVSPTNGTIFSPETTNVNITLSVSNFNVANGTGNGHIAYTINGGSTIMKYDTTPIAVPTTPGNYTIYTELVDNSNNPIAPAQNATISFTVADYIPVTDLGALRADVNANGVGRYYSLASSPKATYTRTTRNQKYIQDAFAGILIDDNTGVLNGLSIIEADAITGLKGQTVNFNNVLQFSPTTNTGVSKNASTAVIPENITVAQYTTNPENYESELIKFTNISLSPTGGNFTSNAEYTVTQGTDTTIFKAIFNEADYISTAVPTSQLDIVVLGGENTTTKFVVARRLENITLDNDKFDNITGLKVYPNPAKQFLNITSASFAEKQVVLYDVLGKVALTGKVTNQPLNVASLPKGVYVAKIIEEGKIATRKVVIE